MSARLKDVSDNALPVGARDIEIHFIKALTQSIRITSPYNHWLLENTLPDLTARHIASLPFEAPKAMTHDGRRESNNSSRIYFTTDHQRKFSIVAKFTKAFDSQEIRKALVAETKANLDDADLRVEYCQDTGDFWLEPHTDIAVKRFTMLIYLSEDPTLSNCGTDVYDSTPDHALVHTAPYRFNGGLIFVPGHDTWHGFSRREINGNRKSLIINYVGPEWRDQWELASPRNDRL
jgi:hypothetical protein